jgi:hypothetical protein
LILLNKIDKFENLFNYQWKNKIQQNASNPNKYYLKDFQLVWFVLQEMPPTKIFPIFLKSKEIESINNILQNLFLKIPFLWWVKWSFGQKNSFLVIIFFSAKKSEFFFISDKTDILVNVATLISEESNLLKTIAAGR